MQLSIGDKIIYQYQDVNGESLKGEIVDIATNNDGEITGYFMATNSGAYIHFHSSSLKWVCLDESVSVSQEWHTDNVH